jgi:hypothetical protein
MASSDDNHCQAVPQANDLHQLDSDNVTLVEGKSSSLTSFRDRFTRKGKKQIGFKASLRAIAVSSCASSILDNEI